MRGSRVSDAASRATLPQPGNFSSRLTSLVVISLDRDRANRVNYSIIVTDSTQSQPFARPFDERSALEELEQLADKIQRSRQQREEKVAEFDAFVRTFRHDRYAATIAASERELRRAENRPSAASAATHAVRGVTPVPDAAKRRRSRSWPSLRRSARRGACRRRASPLSTRRRLGLVGHARPTSASPSQPWP